MDKYYKFWNKKMERCERNGEPMCKHYMTQIERSYKSGMITEEQLNEFKERNIALVCAWAKRRIGA